MENTESTQERTEALRKLREKHPYLDKVAEWSVWLSFSLISVFGAISIWLIMKAAVFIAWVRYVEPSVNPKTKCPACGYRGSNLNFLRTAGPEKAAIEHTCNMCAAKFYSTLVVKADLWLAPLPVKRPGSR